MKAYWKLVGPSDEKVVYCFPVTLGGSLGAKWADQAILIFIMVVEVHVFVGRL